MDDLTFLPALELAQRLRAGRLSAEDLTLSCLEQIDETNPSITAFVEVLRDRALAEARGCDRRLRQRGGDRPPFLGVPIGVKDLNLARGSSLRSTTRSCIACVRAASWSWARRRRASSARCR
jgi:amidase